MLSESAPKPIQFIKAGLSAQCVKRKGSLTATPRCPSIIQEAAKHWYFVLSMGILAARNGWPERLIKNKTRDPPGTSQLTSVLQPSVLLAQSQKFILLLRRCACRYLIARPWAQGVHSGTQGGISSFQASRPSHHAYLSVRWYSALHSHTMRINTLVSSYSCIQPSNKGSCYGHCCVQQGFFIFTFQKYNQKMWQLKRRPFQHSGIKPLSIWKCFNSAMALTLEDKHLSLVASPLYWLPQQQYCVPKPNRAVDA